MKRYYKLLLSLTLIAFISSCINMMDKAQNVPIIGKVSVSYKISAATGFIPKGGQVTPDPNFSTAGIPVQFTELTTGAVIVGTTDADGIVTVEITPGDYSIMVTGTVENDGDNYFLNGTVPAISLVKEITKEEAMADNGLIIRPAKVGSLLLAELYYCGSRAPSGSTWFRDQCYHIYNNGDEVEYLDGVCLAQLHPNIATAGSALPVYPDEEGDNNYVYGLWVWQFPGNGTDYPLQPGESVVVVQEANNHIEATGNPNTLDLTIANWECWTGNVQRDNPDVDNMPLCYAQYLNKLQWLASVMGGAYCLFRADDGTVISAEYYEDNKNTQTEVNKKNRYARISADWILDGVELLGDMSLMSQKRIPGFVDAGASSVNETYVGKSVSRKVISRRADGTPIFADTNNSTEDFEINDTPAVRRHGQKAPAWDKNN